MFVPVFREWIYAMQKNNNEHSWVQLGWNGCNRPGGGGKGVICNSEKRCDSKNNSGMQF